MAESTRTTAAVLRHQGRLRGLSVKARRKQVVSALRPLRRSVKVRHEHVVSALRQLGRSVKRRYELPPTVV